MGRGDDLLDNIETGPPPEKLVKNWPCDFLTFVPLLDTADVRVRDPGKNSLLNKMAMESDIRSNKLDLAVQSKAMNPALVPDSNSPFTISLPAVKVLTLFVYTIKRSLQTPFTSVLRYYQHPSSQMTTKTLAPLKAIPIQVPSCLQR